MRRFVAPGRVNLIGDHTDYTGGLVLPMAIDLSTVVEGERLGSTIELDSRELEGHVSLPLGASHGPGTTPSWGRYVAAVSSLVKPTVGFRGTVSTGIPVGGGLSSSAALEVATALALGADTDPERLALLCREAEHLATGVPTGIMDQLCITSAREGHATLIDCTSLAVRHVPVPEDVEIVVRFVAHRTLEGSPYADRVDECRQAEQQVGPLRDASRDDVERIADTTVRSRARHVVTENARVTDFATALGRGDWVSAGAIMTDGHRSLSSDFAVSTAQMDTEVARTNEVSGVFGTRMTGGGFGGCIVSLCRPGTEIPGWKVRASHGAREVTQSDGR